MHNAELILRGKVWEGPLEQMNFIWFWKSGTVCRKPWGYEIAFCVQGPICSLSPYLQDWGVNGMRKQAGYQSYAQTMSQESDLMMVFLSQSK